MSSKPSSNDAPDRVVVHLHIGPEARKVLRLVAASRGTSVAEMITTWATTEARVLGLVADDLPALPAGISPTQRINWCYRSNFGRAVPLDQVPALIRRVVDAGAGSGSSFQADVSTVHVSQRPTVLGWLQAHAPEGVRVDDHQAQTSIEDMLLAAEDLAVGLPDLHVDGEDVNELEVLVKIGDLCELASKIARARADGTHRTDGQGPVEPWLEDLIKDAGRVESDSAH